MPARDVGCAPRLTVGRSTGRPEASVRQATKEAPLQWQSIEPGIGEDPCEAASWRVCLGFQSHLKIITRLPLADLANKPKIATLMLRASHSGCFHLLRRERPLLQGESEGSKPEGSREDARRKMFPGSPGYWATVGEARLARPAWVWHRGARRSQTR